MLLDNKETTAIERKGASNYAIQRFKKTISSVKARY